MKKAILSVLLLSSLVVGTISTSADVIEPQGKQHPCMNSVCLYA